MTPEDLLNKIHALAKKYAKSNDFNDYKKILDLIKSTESGFRCPVPLSFIRRIILDYQRKQPKKPV